MESLQIEKHPLEPFLPKHTKVLMLGSFPPPQKRWSMNFFYPNYTNDMWRILGLIFFQDKEYFLIPEKKTFKIDLIVDFLNQKGIGLFDTATEVIRLKENASDKFLEVVTPTPVDSFLDQLPQCKAIVTTGEKATDTLCELFQITQKVKVGKSVSFLYKNKEYLLFRMPSSSRAYPIAVEKKAEKYQSMFNQINL